MGSSGLLRARSAVVLGGVISMSLTADSSTRYVIEVVEGTAGSGTGNVNFDISAGGVEMIGAADGGGANGNARGYLPFYSQEGELVQIQMNRTSMTTGLLVVHYRRISQ